MPVTKPERSETGAPGSGSGAGVWSTGYLAAMANCHYHPEVVAETNCERCTEPICDPCIRFDGGRKVCEPCLQATQKEQRQAGIRRAAVRFGVVALMGALIWGVAHYEVNFDYGSRESKVDAEENALKENSCDGAAMVRLVGLMVDAGNEDEGLQRSLEFLDRCPENPKLRQMVYDQYQQRGETDQAIAQVDKLLAANPQDPDYWTWRGLQHLHKSSWQKAAADLQQATVLRPDGEGVPLHLANAYAQAGEPCAGIPPLRKLLYLHPDLPEEGEVRKNLATLMVNPACASWRGTGKADFHFIAGNPGILADVTLNGQQKGTFLIDTEVSYVALGQSFAAKAGIMAIPGQEWMVLTEMGHEKLPHLQVSRLDAGGAATGQVNVVLLPRDLRGADGVLGLDFITRFASVGKYADLRLEEDAIPAPTKPPSTAP